MTGLFPDEMRPTGEAREALNSRLELIDTQMETLKFATNFGPYAIFSLLTVSACTSCN